VTVLTLSKALNEGLRKSLEADPKVLIMGEDVGKLGGVFRVTDGLQKDFGESRVVDTPLAESGTPEVYFVHAAGLRVVACSGPADAFTMIQQSIASDDPVIFFEPKRRYWDKAEVDTAADLSGAVPLTSARTVAEGSDVTVVSYGPLVRTCLEAAVAAREDGRSLDVIDLRSLSPLDMGSVVASVRKTGRCVVVHAAPVMRVGGFSTPYPPSRLEEYYLPDLDRVLDAVDRVSAF